LYEKFESEIRAAEIVCTGLINNSQNAHSPDVHRVSQVFSKPKETLVRSFLLCPSNLRWKLYLIGARLEIKIGNVHAARLLAQRALLDVPVKSKATVLIECSRLEEFIGNISNARKILQRARMEIEHDWRSYFESISLESRQNSLHTAIKIAKKAVQLHNGTGRIWAIYIQLFHRLQSRNLFKLGSDQVIRFASSATALNLISKKAINEVPKSGEVWCEMGRCSLNPLLEQQFNLHFAQQALMFAIQFTPQYGDTFIEFLRLEILLQVFLRVICEKVLFISFDGFMQNFCVFDSESDVVKSNLTTSSSTLFNITITEEIRKLRRERIHELLRGDEVGSNAARIQNTIFSYLNDTSTKDFPSLNRR
jgi:tetratricopeptide (TPR) repeat protein